MARGELLFEARNLVKHFGPTVALNGVDFKVYRGEITGLIGENGSGKSTITSIAAGMQPATSGEMFFKGQPHKPSTMIEGAKLGIGMIVQEQGTVSGISVAQNIFLGEEGRFAKAGIVSRRKMNAEAKKALDAIGFEGVDPGAMIDSLNLQDRKLVEIAKTVYEEPEMLVVDETTTALSQRGRDIIYRIMARMRDENKAVVFISHDLEELMEVCDTLTVLRDGNIITTYDKDEYEPEAIKTAMIGREMTGDYYRSDYDGSYSSEVVLKADNITTGTGMLMNFSIELHKGEILGVGGLSHCSWITNGTDRPFYARRVIMIGKPIARAMASVCGLGQFEFHVNGAKIGDHELDPAWTDYDKAVEYVTFDITDALHEGENVIGAEVGNGWFIKNDEHYTFKFPDFMPPNPNPYVPYGDCLVLTAKMTVIYTDGTCEEITADASWKTASHPVIQSNVYGSETIDYSLTQAGWDMPGFDDAAWVPAIAVPEEKKPKGKFIPMKRPPIKVIRSYQGKRIGNVSVPGGVREVYTFGQNMAGLISVSLKGKKGDVVRLYPSEKLTADGDVDQVMKNWVTLDAAETFIIGEDDQWEDFRMKFTYFAGMFAGIEKSSPTIEVRGLRADAITSAWKEAGTFISDDDRFNQIYTMIERTVEANMVSVHTDCPTIERFAWQEPNHLMAPSIFFMKDGKALWEKFLMDLRLGQHTAEDSFRDLAGNPWYPGEGLVPAQAPCYIHNVLPVPGMGSFYDIIPWGSTCILGTWWHYMFYGDLQIVRDNYETGMRYLNHLKTKVNKEGFLNHGLGDWGNPENELARENIETAFLYADTIVLKQFASWLGKDADEVSLDAYAAQVKANYNEKLLVYDETRGYWCYRAYDHPDEIIITQAVEAMPLYWGLVPEDKEADVVKAFTEALDQKGAFAAGEVGLPYVIQTAGKYGMHEKICEFITRKEHPSYYAFILDGQTTLGEYWETNPRSQCHDMMGHIIEWYYNGLAGIKPLKPGFTEVEIRPYLPSGMNSFDCTYRAPQGEIRVHARRDVHGLPRYEISVPDGIRKV